MNLFPSTLVINGSQIEIDKLLSKIGHKQIKNNPDIFELSEYTIAQVRQISSFLSQKPISHQSKVVLINEAHLLQIEAQNALLKNLEEPGPDNYFVLVTSRPNSLLPTILSRCHQIIFPAIAQIDDTILKIPDKAIDRLLLSEKLVRDKQGTLKYLENQLYLFHQQLIQEPSPTNTQMINKITKSIALLKSNLDPKTVLDFLLLS